MRRPDPPDPTDFDPTAHRPAPTERTPEKETPGVQVTEGSLSNYARTARPADTTDLDWHATPQQPDRHPTPVPPVAPPTSTPGPATGGARAGPPTDTLLVHSPPAPLWTPAPVPEVAAPPPTPPPPMPSLGAEATPAPVQRAPAPTAEPARPRAGEPISFATRAVQIVVLSVLAGGLAAIGAVVASALTGPGSEGLSVVVPSDPAPEAGPAP
jgi:hypothetical protein